MKEEHYEMNMKILSKEEIQKIRERQREDLKKCRELIQQEKANGTWKQLV